jgi:hypothetical protein
MNPLTRLTGAEFLSISGSSSIFSAPFSVNFLPNQAPVEKSRCNGTASTGGFLARVGRYESVSDLLLTAIAINSR